MHAFCCCHSLKKLQPFQMSALTAVLYRAPRQICSLHSSLVKSQEQAPRSCCWLPPIRSTIMRASVLGPSARLHTSLQHRSSRFECLQSQCTRAVLALMQMLRRSAGALELVDVSQELPALKRQQGKTHWVVKDRSGYRKSYSEVQQVCPLAAHATWPLACQLGLSEHDLEWTWSLPLIRPS